MFWDAALLQRHCWSMTIISRQNKKAMENMGLFGSAPADLSGCVPLGLIAHV